MIGVRGWYDIMVSNVLPEAVYCCFTRTTLFTTMFTVIIVVCLLKRICMLCERVTWPSMPLS